MYEQAARQELGLGRMSQTGDSRPALILFAAEDGAAVSQAGQLDPVP